MNLGLWSYEAEAVLVAALYQPTVPTLLPLHLLYFDDFVFSFMSSSPLVLAFNCLGFLSSLLIVNPDLQHSRNILDQATLEDEIAWNPCSAS